MNEFGKIIHPHFRRAGNGSGPVGGLHGSGSVVGPIRFGRGADPILEGHVEWLLGWLPKSGHDFIFMYIILTISVLRGLFR